MRLLVIAVVAVIVTLNDAKPGQLNHQRHEFHKIEQSSRIVETNFNGGRSTNMDLTNARPNYQMNAGWSAWQRNHIDDIRRVAEELRSKYNDKLMLSDYQRQQYVNTGDTDCKVLCNQPQVAWTSFSAKSQAEVDEFTKSLTHKIFEEIGKGDLVQMQISQPNWFEHRAGNELETLFYKKNVSLLGPQSQTNVHTSNEDEDLRQTQQAVFDQSQSVESQRQSSVYSQQREKQDRYVSPYPSYGTTYQRQFQISREQQSNRPTLEVGFDQNVLNERQSALYNQQREREDRYGSRTNSQSYYQRQLEAREKQTRTQESGSDVRPQTSYQNQYHQVEDHSQEDEGQVSQTVNQFDQSDFDSEDTQRHVTDVQSNIPVVDGSYFDQRSKSQQDQTRVTLSTSSVDEDERERRERTRYQQIHGQSRESTNTQEQSEYSRDRSTTSTTGTQQQSYGWQYRTPITPSTVITSTSTSTTTTQRPQNIQSTNKHSIYDHLNHEEEEVINYRPQVIVSDINQYQHTTTQQEREDLIRRQNQYRGQTREEEYKEVREDDEEEEDTQQRVQQPDFSDLSVLSQLNKTERTEVSNTHSTNLNQENVMEREAEDVIRSHDYHQSSGSQRNETAEREAYYAELAKQEKEQTARTRPYIYNVYNKHDGRMRSEAERHRIEIQRQQAERQLTETERLTLEREREYERQRLRQQTGYDGRTQQTSRRDEQLSQTTYQSRPYAHRGIQTNTEKREEIEEHNRQYNSGSKYEAQTSEEDTRQQQINVNDHDTQSIHQSSSTHDDELSHYTSVQEREKENERRRQHDYRAQQTQLTQSETSTTTQNENSHVMSLVPKRQQQEQNRKVTEEELLRTINIMKHEDSEYDGQMRQKETYNNREQQVASNNNKYANTNPQEYNVHYGQTVEDGLDQTNQTVDNRNKTKVYGFHDDQKPKPAEINDKRGDQPPRHTELDYEESDEVEDEPGIGKYPVAKKPEIGLAPQSVYNQIREESTTTIRPIPTINVHEDQQQRENIEDDRDLNQQTQQVFPGQTPQSEYERRQYQRTHSYSQTTTTGLSRPVQYAATHHELDDNLNQQTMDLTVKPLYPSSAQISTVTYQSSTQRSEAQQRETTQYSNERRQNEHQQTSGSDSVYGSERSRYNRTNSQTHSERTNEYHQTNESNEQDDTQQLVDLGQEREDFSQQTQDMSQQDLTQQRQPANEYNSGSNWRRTGIYRRRNETQLQSASHTLENNQDTDDGQKTVMFGQETEDLTQQTQDLRQQAGDLSQQQQSTGGQYHRSNTYQHANEQRQHQVSSQSQIKQESDEDDGQQTVDFGQETEDLRQQHQSFGFDKDDLRQKEERENYYQQQTSGQYSTSQQREMTLVNAEQKDINEHQATVVEVDTTTTAKPTGIRSYLNKAKNWFG